VSYYQPQAISLTATGTGFRQRRSKIAPMWRLKLHTFGGRKLHTPRSRIVFWSGGAAMSSPEAAEWHLRKGEQTEAQPQALCVAIARHSWLFNSENDALGPE
jgi:hypothetical protein